MSYEKEGLDYNINISNSTSQNQRVDEKTKTNEKKIPIGYIIKKILFPSTFPLIKAKLI